MSEADKAELRRIIGPGRVGAIDTTRVTADSAVEMIREAHPVAVFFDHATPPHTTAIRTALAELVPILEATTELRADSGPHGPAARRLPALGLRNEHGDVEPLPDGALDPRRQ